MTAYSPVLVFKTPTKSSSTSSAAMQARFRLGSPATVFWRQGAHEPKENVLSELGGRKMSEQRREEKHRRGSFGRLRTGSSTPRDKAFVCDRSAKHFAPSKNISTKGP